MGRGKTPILLKPLRKTPFPKNMLGPVNPPPLPPPPIQHSEKQLSYYHPVYPIRFLLHVQDLVREIRPSLHNRLHRGLQHRTENNLQPPHQPVNRELCRIHKALQGNRLQTLLDNPETRQPPADSPDLLQVTLRKLLL